ncbi:MAG: cyclic nucleotide-binding domain-containing protein [Spirochaetales bacterium]|nr:cyclic nucleotide-binding domain-containing protein [Spirochaetales bacterium]
MEKIKVTAGVYWVDIPAADLRVLCGCPADIVKHLQKRGLIVGRVKGDVEYETGPNAILLSDTSIQNGQFSNLAEFPMLQMFYRQGILIPGHPCNTGRRPLLIGIPNQISAQSEYIMRGNYGLLTLEEIVAAGVPKPMARAMYELKLKFAFNRMRPVEELLEYRLMEKEPVELREGVTLRRRKLNVYDFCHDGQTVTVDLNLGKNEQYEPAVRLDFHKINREYFSVIHIGEGDGWDPTRPCMASIITYQGKIFLIDAGPNIIHTLTALGISVNEIEGIFHTHAHDDHFAGLTSLVRSDHRIKYYATPLVRSSVSKKIATLMSISEQRFMNAFEIRDLEDGAWNDLDGLEVMPVFSPHPVETTVFFFRTFWEDGYKTYAHLADIPSFKVLDDLLLRASVKNKQSRLIYRNFKESITGAVQLKKIDVGGGMIHGDAEDFIEDESQKIILSHTSRELTDAQKEIGSNATFAMEDVLIHAHKNYSMQSAFNYLRSLFPQAKTHDLNMLLNCYEMAVNVGMIIIKKGSVNRYIYLILNGVVEFIDSENGIHNELSAGSFIGELSALTNSPSRRTYRAMSYVRVLQIPIELYKAFISRNFQYRDIKRINENLNFIQCTDLFGEMVSSVIQNRIAQEMRPMSLDKGKPIVVDEKPAIYMLKKGKARIYFEDTPVDVLLAGDFFGEESILLGSSSLFSAKAEKSSELLVIPAESLKDIPIIEWKILEIFERRLSAFGTQLRTS